MLNIHSIELTSVCNLKCVHCPSSTSVYPQGMMTPAMFQTCLQYVPPDKSVVVVGFGEPLVHPDLAGVLSMAKKMNRKLAMHTNGILFNEENLKILCENNVMYLEVSIHTQKSLAGYKLAYKYVTENYPGVEIIPHMMSCYEEKLPEWIKSTGIPVEYLKDLNILGMHNWAMNDREYTPEANREWQNKCSFLGSNTCVIRWDGRVYTCCPDSEGVNYVGHVYDFPNLNFKWETFNLCHKCSPAWFTGTPIQVKKPDFQK